MKGVIFISFAAAFLPLITAADPNFKNIFKQTTKEANNEVLNDITGSIPSWLSGDLVRQNCASFGNIDGARYEYVSHLFDCIPMVGRYKIEGNNITYSNKRFDTKPNRIWMHFNYNMSESKVGWHTIFSDISPAAFQKYSRMSWNETLYVSPTVNFWKSRASDPILAMTESLYSPTEVKSRPELSLGWYFPKIRDMKFPSWFNPRATQHQITNNPAHEQRDPDGTIWSSTLDIELSDHTTKFNNLELAVAVYKMKGPNRTLEARHVLGKYNTSFCSSPLSQAQRDIMPGYAHYVQSTEKFILVPQTSYRYDYCQVSNNTGSLKPGFIYSYAWHPEVNTSILIFERQNLSKVHHVYLPYAKMFTHDLNAFEDTTHVYLDTLAYDNADAYLKVPVIKEALADYNWNSSFMHIAIDKRTWLYDPAKSMYLTEQEKYGKAEFPVINYDRFHQKDYTYVYFVHNALYRGAKIAKLNVKTKQVIYWDPPAGYYPHEPVFVQADDAVGEDEGVIISAGPISSPAGTSFMVILNAKDLSQVALVKNPNNAPYGLHNRFYKVGPNTTKAPSTTKMIPKTNSTMMPTRNVTTTRRPVSTTKVPAGATMVATSFATIAVSAVFATFFAV